MSSEPTGTTPEPGTQPGATTATGATAAPATTAEPGPEERSFSPEAVRRLIGDEVKPLKQQLKDLGTERDALLAEKQTREQAEMTELERLKVAAEKATAGEAVARAEAEESKATALRMTLIARQAPHLPAPYQALVVGQDEESVTQSITEAAQQYQQMADTVRDEWLTKLATMPPEALDELCDAAKPLAARLKQRPGSIGAPSAAPAAQPPGPEAGSTQDWLAQRQQMGLPTVGVGLTPPPTPPQ